MTLLKRSLTMIGQDPNIEILDLVGSKLSNKDLGLLNSPRLGILDLSESNLGDLGVEQLGICPNLSEVSINRTAITAVAAKKLARLPKLTLLNVAGCSFGNVGLAEIGKAKNLDQLDIKDSNITDSGLAELRQSPLTWLQLERNQVSDAGMEYLSKMKNLKTVILNETPVSVKGIETLCKNKKMRLILIQNCPKISKDAVKGLKKKFPEVDFQSEPT